MDVGQTVEPSDTLVDDCFLNKYCCRTIENGMQTFPKYQSICINWCICTFTKSVLFSQTFTLTIQLILGFLFIDFSLRIQQHCESVTYENIYRTEMSESFIEIDPFSFVVIVVVIVNAYLFPFFDWNNHCVTNENENWNEYNL